jgi:hypothetical protein
MNKFKGYVENVFITLSNIRLNQLMLVRLSLSKPPSSLALRQVGLHSAQCDNFDRLSYRGML